MTKKHNFIIRTITGTLALVVVPLILAVAVTIFAKPETASAAGASSSVSHCRKSFFGMRAWYYYMEDEFTNSYAAADAQADRCEIKCFNIFNLSQPNDCGKKSSDIPAVLLAVIDDLLRIAGIVAVFYVLIGGFKYVISEGNPEKTSLAKSSIVNALIGMGIAMIAIAFISYVGNKLS
ncbi:MAG: hypothetical protein AAB971_01105 [Patescibacteria group bacterium]